MTTLEELADIRREAEEYRETFTVYATWTKAQADSQKQQQMVQLSQSKTEQTKHGHQVKRE